MFISLIHHFEAVFTNIAEYRPQHSQKIEIAMFNMVGTLIANSETCSQKLVDSLNYYIELISQSDVLQNENVEKFVQYFGDKDACDQFKVDFFEIEASEKNDTLYTDMREDASNQFFAMLLIKAKSEDPDKAVCEKHSEYFSSKAARILSHTTLVKSLRLSLKNFSLEIKSNRVRNNRELGMNGYTWITMSDHGNVSQLVTECCNFVPLFPIIEKLYTLKLKLLNIFFNHYTIRNSLDTHFVAAKLNLIEDNLQEARLNLTERISEIEGVGVSLK